MAVWGSSPKDRTSSRTSLVLQEKRCSAQRAPSEVLLHGSIVLTHCVLPPVHIGQDLVYSGITGYEPFKNC